MASDYDFELIEEMSRRRDGDARDNLISILRNFGLWNLLVQDRLKLPPPASKEAVKALAEVKITETDKQCPVCLKCFSENETVLLMPCKHTFHKECISPWLEKTNSCPLCRYELPTDDEEYELLRKEKERAKVREKEIEQLHNSMYT